LVDISEQMLKVAMQRFKDMDNFRFEILDYSSAFPAKSFDLVSSALSIHHLEETQKEKLYENIFASLPDGGCFINHDQFNAASAAMNGLYNSIWHKSIQNSGLTENELQKWLERRELDRENTIELTVNLLKKAGFRTVECVYSYMKFGVIWAMK
jgi:ubiquinone/menaquinone biosynthesis C-methylase UbiE